MWPFKAPNPWPSVLSPARPFMISRTVVLKFLGRYPRIRLSSFQMSGPEQAEALLRHRIDLGFVHPPVPDSELFSFENVAEERFVAALPSSHRLASRKRVRTSELSSEKFVLFPRPLAPGCYDAIQRICGDAGFVPDVVHESNAVSVSLNLIPALGVVTLFPECVRSQTTPGVAYKDLEGRVTTVTCGFLRRSGDTAAPVERFLRLWRSLKKSKSAG
jgi:DNA-binding transcriptional LysR family regulator